ncbi:MAG: aspartate/glutamate racemase family protein [Gemmatimonadota bacterium]|nr:MAG: aspartate/glutamate racemase family protein [Gemmatimonadota bacterium]
MKTIGLIGGMSWESTVPYYRTINETVKQELGGLHSANIVLYSVDFQPIEQLQHADRWDETGHILAGAARSLERAGADCIVLCTNTMHRVAASIRESVNIPFLHIADATGAAIASAGLQTVALLGTKFTMEQEFYRGWLQDNHRLDVLIPDERDRDVIHRIIYDELCLGQLLEKSRDSFRRIIESLVVDGAEGVILGCTEIALLVGPSDSAVPLFDTADLHARYAVDWALGGAKA